jgi:N utilization substance protein A
MAGKVEASGLRAALDDLSAETELSESDLAAAMEQAVAETYRRLIEDDPEVHARVDLSRGSFDLYRLGDSGVETPVPADARDFPRQAAAAARAAVAERLVEADRRKVLQEADARHGELVDGIVERRAGPAWYLRIGEVHALLPPEEQIPNERLALHQHLKVLVLEGRRRVHDAVIVVSRSHPLLLQRLLEQEVPELLTGQVVVRGIAREPGRRSKVAVEAPAGDIDPQGACIGPRGIRHRAVTSELGEEQVQIVSWSADPGQYVANALTPATALNVAIDVDTRTARVTVPPDQLSLAIGRGGENARLVARLTGLRIDIAAAE